MSLVLLAEETQQIGSPVLGVVIPAVILVVACWVTWALYKHFAN